MQEYDEETHSSSGARHQRRFRIENLMGSDKSAARNGRILSDDDSESPVHLPGRATQARSWADMSAPCIALFEDFDTVFNLRAPANDKILLTFECVKRYFWRK